MSFYFVFIFFCFFSLTGVVSKGSFWQISDLHLNSKYSIHGDPESMCQGNDPKQNLSEYGNYKCDSPWLLIEQSILNMKRLYEQPDFILWTGDVMAHRADAEITWSDVYGALKNVTQLLHTEFPNASILPIIGNHDVHPANHFPKEGFREVYENYLKLAGWDQLIPSDQNDSFLEGGYYCKEVSDKLRVIALNTNLYLSHNKNLTRDDKDPDGQLQWLRERFEKAKRDQVMVIIVAHAPPGYFERNPIEPFLTSPFTENFIEMVNEFGEIILTQVYGHTHTDSFRLFLDEKDSVKTHGFIAPAISPLGLLGMKGINPSIRLYDYSLDKRTILNYRQYCLNLSALHSTEIGTRPRRSDSVRWQLLYSACETYNVPDLSIRSLHDIYQKLIWNKDYFRTYYLYNIAGVKGEPCNHNCFVTHICAITKLKKGEMEECLSHESRFTTASPLPIHTTEGKDRHHHPRRISAQTKYIIMGIAFGLFLALVIMTVVASAFCVRRRFNSGFRYQRHTPYNGS